MDGTQKKTDEVADAINYLRAKYCREIEGNPVSEQEAHLSDNCYQYTGIFRGERVYWGACLE